MADKRRCGVHAATYHVLPSLSLRVSTSPSRAVCSSGGDSGARVRSGIGLQKAREKHLGASEQAEQLRQSPPRPQGEGKGSALIARHSGRLASDSRAANASARHWAITLTLTWCLTLMLLPQALEALHIHLSCYSTPLPYSQLHPHSTLMPTPSRTLATVTFFSTHS